MKRAVAKETVEEAVVEIAGMIFRGNEVDGVATVVRILHVRAVAIATDEEAPAVAPGAAEIIGDEIVGIKADAAVE